MPVRVTEAEMRALLAKPVRQRTAIVPPVGYPCTQSVFLMLPYPPLNNHYFRHVGPRVLLSAAGRQYRATVAGLVLTQIPQGVLRPFHNRLWCEFIVHAPDKRRYDLDNVPKAIQDALQYAGVYLNDWQIDELHIRRGEPCKRGRVNVHMKPIA